jgi:multiple sugar transport system permease protein
MKETEQRDKWARRALGSARVLVIYGLLLGGAVVFSLPFVWMIGTSMKVDREMFGDRITLFPMRPEAAPASPYLDDRFFVEPDAASAYERVRPVIVEQLSRSDFTVPAYVDGAERWIEILTPGIYRRLQDTLPVALWRGDDDELFAAIRERVQDALIQETAQRVLRRFTLGSIRVRSFDLQEEDLTDGLAMPEYWDISGPARLEEDLLIYDFRQTDEGRITLKAVLDLPFDADRLHRTTLYFRPDDSWHAVRFYLEKNGVRYEAVRPEYLGDFQWGAVILQEYGPDDESIKIRNWLAYREADRGPQYESRPDKAQLILVIEEADQRRAWWAKMQGNYRDAMDYLPFWRYTATSIFLVVLNIIGNIFSCSLVAYAFARLHWPGRNLSFGLMLATLMIPPQVTMIPYFLIIRALGWYNTLYPLWVISFFGNAFNIFLLRQFMKGIPRDLEDAAKIDGCNFLQIYWYVIMPLIKPTLACISIFTFMAVWNDFMGPLIYLSDQRLYPLSLGLYAFNVQAGGNLGMMMAGSLLMTVPVIVIFFFAQKYFIQGVTLTGIKG